MLQYAVSSTLYCTNAVGLQKLPPTLPFGLCEQWSRNQATSRSLCIGLLCLNACLLSMSLSCFSTDKRLEGGCQRATLLLRSVCRLPRARSPKQTLLLFPLVCSLDPTSINISLLTSNSCRQSMRHKVSAWTSSAHVREAKRPAALNQNSASQYRYNAIRWLVMRAEA